jgi:hypothetical protein
VLGANKRPWQPWVHAMDMTKCGLPRRFQKIIKILDPSPVYQQFPEMTPLKAGLRVGFL